MRSKLQHVRVGVYSAVCAAVLVAAAVLLLALGAHRFEGKTSHERVSATAAGRTAPAAADKTERAEPAVRARAVESYGKLPLSFEANQGQTDRQVKFLARGGGYSLFLTGNEAVLALKKSVAPAFRPAHERSADLAFGSAALPGWLQSPAAKAHQGSADLFSKSEALPGLLTSRAAKLETNSRTADPKTGSALQGLALLPTTEQFKDSFARGGEAQIPDPESRAPAVLRMKLVGANARANVTGLDELPGKSN